MSFTQVNEFEKLLETEEGQEVYAQTKKNLGCEKEMLTDDPSISDTNPSVSDAECTVHVYRGSYNIWSAIPNFKL